MSANHISIFYFSRHTYEKTCQVTEFCEISSFFSTDIALLEAPVPMFSAENCVKAHEVHAPSCNVCKVKLVFSWNGGASDLSGKYGGRNEC